MQCSICSGVIDDHRYHKTGEVYWTDGHNAEPVNDGRCCTSCNASVVIPARINRISANALEEEYGEDRRMG